MRIIPALFGQNQAYANSVTPGAGPFLAQGHNLINFGRGPLVDATYQISRL